MKEEKYMTGHEKEGYNMAEGL